MPPGNQEPAIDKSFSDKLVNFFIPTKQALRESKTDLARAKTTDTQMSFLGNLSERIENFVKTPPRDDKTEYQPLLNFKEDIKLLSKKAEDDYTPHVPNDWNFENRGIVAHKYTRRDDGTYLIRRVEPRPLATAADSNDRFRRVKIDGPIGSLSVESKDKDKSELSDAPPILEPLRPSHALDERSREGRGGR